MITVLLLLGVLSQTVAVAKPLTKVMLSSKPDFKFPWKVASKGVNKATFPRDPDFAFSWDIGVKEVKKPKEKKPDNALGKTQTRAATVVVGTRTVSTWETVFWTTLVLSFMISIGLIVVICLQIRRRRRYNRIFGINNGTYFVPPQTCIRKRTPFASSSNTVTARYYDENSLL